MILGWFVFGLLSLGVVQGCDPTYREQHGCKSADSCSEGQGDCDFDYQCSGQLKCGNSNCLNFAGNADRRYVADDDCCYKHVCLGGDDCCGFGNPCSAGEGDCDRSDGCAGHLNCGKSNCRFEGKVEGNWDSSDDCCTNACYGDDNCCGYEHKCNFGEGDCDSDSDCWAPGKCGNRNCDLAISTFEASDDCCYDPSKASPTQRGHPGEYTRIYTNWRCTEQGHDWYGYDMYTIVRASVTKEECSYFCQENQMCKTWLWIGNWHGSNRCWIKKHDAPSMRRPLPGADVWSGRKNC